MDSLQITTHSVLFVQLNDLYHIDTSIDYTNDESLILPRIATLIKRLRGYYGHERVLFCLPGDFLGPSCLSKEFLGEQMVSVLNAMELNYVTLGNHEFEKEFTLQDIVQRIEESNFQWIVSNIVFRDHELHDRLLGQKKLLLYEVLPLTGDSAIILLGALTPGHYPSKEQTIVRALDPVMCTQACVDRAQDELRQAREMYPDRCYDNLIFVALTHQTLKEDRALAKQRPALRLIMGGHDHNVRKQDTTYCLITKTLSNAKTLRLNWVVAVPAYQVDSQIERHEDAAFVIGEVIGYLMRGLLSRTISIAFFEKEKPTHADVARYGTYLQRYLEGGAIADDTRVGHRRVGGEYIFIFSIALDMTIEGLITAVPEEPEVRRQILFWLSRSSETTHTIIEAPVTFSLEDKIIRRQSTNFGNLIADILRGVLSLRDLSRQPADVALINSGCFRLDRNIQQNERITQKTICDIFFHENSVSLFRLTGEELRALLQKSLEMLRQNEDVESEGHGDFLQLSGLEIETHNGQITTIHQVSKYGQRTHLEPREIYTVATTDYVACEAYKEWFEGKESQLLAADVKATVEAELRKWHEIEEALPLAAFIHDTPRWM